MLTVRCISLRTRITYIFTYLLALHRHSAVPIPILLNSAARGWCLSRHDSTITNSAPRQFTGRKQRAVSIPSTKFAVRVYKCRQVLAPADELC